MSEAKNQQAEPSMEEILASIRRIISEDSDTGKGQPAAAAAPAAAAPAPAPASPPAAAPPPPEPAAAAEVLELTEMVDDDGKVTEAEDEAPSAPPPAAPASPDERLVSRHAATAAAGALAGLAAASRRPDSELRGAVGLGNGAMTLEDIVRTEMRPILKAWLDENLPPLVERLVQKEIKRITRQVDET